MLKELDNPPALYPVEARLPGDLAGPWWVAHTLSRFEKAFARDLIRLGVAYFLPVIERTTISTGRRRRSEVPLFPGYVFVCCDNEQRPGILRTHRLCSLLEVPDPPALARQLDDIMRLLASGHGVYARNRLARGRRCRVTAGSLAGVEGVVERDAGAERLVINVDMLGRGAAVEIDANLLELVE